jgi:hypothetical protein
MVIDFYATWCGPCVLLAPQLEEVASHYKGNVRFLKIDSDENDSISSAMKVRYHSHSGVRRCLLNSAVQIFALPTLLFINNGKVLKRIEGQCQMDSSLLTSLSDSVLPYSGALMANKLQSICDFLFFDGPMPEDKDVKNLLNEDDLLV